LVAACSSTSSSSSVSSTTSQPDGAELDSALTAWAGFPVGSSPRPIVLTGGSVLDPEYGFPDDTSKIAYGNGEINAPASWPQSPGSSMGFTIIGAPVAFKTLTTPNGVIGTPPPLSTSGVQLGSATFLTDRGNRDLPAWLFSLSGVQNPAKVLAVSPSEVYSAPVVNEGSDLADLSATIGVDDRTMVVSFPGAPAGTGPCTSDYTLSIAESKQAVAVAVVAHPHQAAGQNCTSVGYQRNATAELPSPLQARVVVDAASSGPVTVTSAPSAPPKLAPTTNCPTPGEATLVPDVVGVTAEVAYERLTKAGLLAGTEPIGGGVGEPTPPIAQPGSVVTESPAAGTRSSVGDKVTLAVAVNSTASSGGGYPAPASSLPLDWCSTG
jgi:hypothetical protein